MKRDQQYTKATRIDQWVILLERTHITQHWRCIQQYRHCPVNIKCQSPTRTSSGALVWSGSLLGDPIPGVEEVLLSRSLKPCASNRVEIELEWNRPSHSLSWPGKEEADDHAVHFWKNGNDTFLSFSWTYTVPLSLPPVIICKLATQNPGYSILNCKQLSSGIQEPAVILF